MYWILVLVAVNANGTVNISTQYPTSYTNNNEKSCDESGKKAANEMQLEKGTKNSKVFWLCRSAEFETIVKALPPEE